MAQASHLDHESSAVQKHLEIMQGVIARMADNSRSCKVWCITLVAALLLERRFRKSYDIFVGKVHVGQATASDLYTVVPCGSTARVMLWAMCRSFAVLPFYAVVVATVLLAWLLTV